jgi:hypothetical protein
VAVTGMASGSMMVKNTRKKLAPSTTAASSSSLGSWRK